MKIMILGLVILSVVISVGILYTTTLTSVSDDQVQSGTYVFQGVEFEEFSECAELFIEYQSAAPYDSKVKVPILLNFDNCDPITP